MLQALIEQTMHDSQTIQTQKAPLQRDVFEETWNTDMSAIEAQLEQPQDASPCTTVVRPKRSRACCQPLSDHPPRIEHRHEPESCTCGQCGRDLVKIDDDCKDAGNRALTVGALGHAGNNCREQRRSQSKSVDQVT